MLIAMIVVTGQPLNPAFFILKPLVWHAGTNGLLESNAGQSCFIIFTVFLTTSISVTVDLIIGAGGTILCDVRKVRKGGVSPEV